MLIWQQSCHAACNLFRLYRPGRQSIMRHSAVSVWWVSTQARKVLPPASALPDAQPNVRSQPSFYQKTPCRIPFESLPQMVITKTLINTDDATFGEHLYYGPLVSNTKTPRQAYMSLNRLPHHCLLKSRWKEQKGDDLRSIWSSTRCCRLRRDEEPSVKHSPYEKG